MSIWSGRKDSGSREYDARDAQVILADLQQHIGRIHATSIESISHRTGRPARVVRAVISDVDGTEFVVAIDESLVFIAEFADDVDHYSRKLRAQVRTMADRLDRRDRFVAAKRLPRKQDGLF